MLVVILIITVIIENSKFGYNLLALKGNESAAEAWELIRLHAR
jgi:ABC-type branched-subunit amino acid transport system permease subunit